MGTFFTSPRNWFLLFCTKLNPWSETTPLLIQLFEVVLKEMFYCICKQYILGHYYSLNCFFSLSTCNADLVYSQKIWNNIQLHAICWNYEKSVRKPPASLQLLILFKWQACMAWILGRTLTGCWFTWGLLKLWKPPETLQFLIL